MKLSGTVMVCMLSLMALAGCKVQVQITSPVNNDMYFVGQEIPLAGTEKNCLPGRFSQTHYVWQLDGAQAAIGSNTTLPALAAGTHTISLAVLDKNGGTVAASEVTVRISGDSIAAAMDECFIGHELPTLLYCTCVVLGYTYDNATCVFPDAKSCSDYAFYRGECGQQWSYCSKQGGMLEHINDDMGSWNASYAVCVFDDGSECGEQAYMEGTCSPSECTQWRMSQGGCVK